MISEVKNGTLTYIALEIVRDETYDANKADLWLLGVILYGTATGKLQWTSQTQT